MKTNPKTIEIKVLQGNYGYGWDDLNEYKADSPADMHDLRDDFKAYEQNETAPHRIITRRIPNPEYSDH